MPEASAHSPAPAAARSSRLCVILLMLAGLLLFQYTRQIRAPFLGDVSGWDAHEWLTGSAAKFAANWYEDGPLALRWAMLEEPASIEFPTLASRQPYGSYPPGVVVPIYVLGRVLGQRPDPLLVMQYNLANHLLIALSMGLIAFVFLRGAGVGRAAALLLALTPLGWELLLPGPLYFHQNVFFSDQAVLLPWVLLLLLETSGDQQPALLRPRQRHGLQATLLFWGMLTDWFFFFVIIGLYVKRLCWGQARWRGRGALTDAAVFFWPPALVALLFGMQILSLGLGPGLLAKFFLRAGLRDPQAGGTLERMTTFWSRFWDGSVPLCYGRGGLIVLLAGVVALVASGAVMIWLRRRRGLGLATARVFTLLALLLLPVLAQLYVFSQHSLVHQFSTLKLAIPLGLIPVLLPVLLLCLARDLGWAQRVVAAAAAGLWPWRVVAAVILLASSAYWISMQGRATSLFPEPSPATENLGRYVAAHSAYQDVVFSPAFDIPANPPLLLAYSRKRVYHFSSPAQLAQQVAGLPADCTVALITLTAANSGPLPPVLVQLLERMTEPQPPEVIVLGRPLLSSPARILARTFKLPRDQVAAILAAQGQDVAASRPAGGSADLPAAADVEQAR